MNQGRVKWIRKVVFSRHPVVLQMVKDKYGEERANKMTYQQVINACKKMWKTHAPGIEKWEILKTEKES